MSLLVALLGFGVYFDHSSNEIAAAPGTLMALHSDLARESASPDVHRVAQWAVHSRDPGGLPFVVVDKAQARLFAFDPQGRLRGSAPVLLGAQRGDQSAVPATPAGRFVADTWLSAQAAGIVWVNENTSLSLQGLPSERAAGEEQRLASPSVEDKRISDGSLHVRGDFYRDVLSPLRTQGSVAYVLPEMLQARDVFHIGESGEHPWELAQSPRPLSARRPS